MTSPVATRPTPVPSSDAPPGTALDVTSSSELAQRRTPTPVVFRRARTAATLPLVMLIAVLLVMLLAVVGSTVGQEILRLGGALDAADRVTRIHDAESEVLAAHQLVTNDVLTGKAPTSTSPVHASLQKASSLLVDAASDNPKQPEAARQATSELVRYAGELNAAHQATDPAARATALAEATKTLDERVAPSFSKAADVESSRLTVLTVPAWIVLAVGIPAAGLVLLGLVIAAQRTHRILSIPLALSLLLTAAATYMAWSGLRDLRGALDSVAQQRGQVAQVAHARTQLARAKAHEASALVNPTQAATVESSWGASMDAADTSLASIPSATDVRANVAAYRKAHAGVRAKAKAGDTKAAIASATGTSAGTAGAAYTAAAEEAARVQQQISQRAKAVQEDRFGELLLPCTLALLAALGALIALWRGFADRLKEYRA